MKYEIVDNMIIDSKGRQIKHYRELPWGWGHFLSGDISSLEGMTTATSFRKNKPEIPSTKKYKNNFE